MNKVQIFGGGGQHGSNIIKRGFFNGFELENIGEANHANIDPNSNKAIIIPINTTKALIENLNDSPCINFSGVMSTTPNNATINCTNIHLLFGPNAQEGLKATIAGKQSEFAKEIIKNLEQKKVEIIETTIEEHDRTMAYIQGLTHLFILICGNKEITKEWNTPVETILDMILYNPFFKEIGEVFLSSIRNDKGINISQLFLDTIGSITNEQRKSFGTPTFKRTVKFCEEMRTRIDEITLNNINYSLSNKTNLKGEIIKKINK